MSLASLAIDKTHEAGHGCIRKYLGEKYEEAIDQSWYDDMFPAQGFHVSHASSLFGSHAGAGALFPDTRSRTKFGLSHAGTKNSHSHAGSFELIFES